MSLNAITWAFNQGDTNPTQRLLLLAYANYANPQDESYPGKELLIEITGLGESTIYRERRALCDMGKLTKIGRMKYRVNWRNSRSDQSGSPEDSRSESETLAPRKALDKGTQKNPDAQPAAAPDERDEPQLLWHEYETIVRGKVEEHLTDVTPSMRRTAEKALKEYPFDDLVTALRGFMVWRNKKPGDMRFSSIFASHPGGRPLHDHIGFWIEQAGDASPLQGIPSEERVKISRLVRDVQRGHGSRDAETVQQASKAMDELRERGIELTPRAGDGLPVLKP